MLNQQMYLDFIHILEEELVPATGCTEPIAIALAAAKARSVLGRLPERLLVRCSRNIFKNTRSVTVPNSDGLVGIKAAAILGTLAGNPDLGMEVLADVDAGLFEKAQSLSVGSFCEVGLLQSDLELHIQVQASAGNETAFVETKYAHTNITLIEKNGETQFALQENVEKYLSAYTDRSILSVAEILTFANQVNLADVRDQIARQIQNNLTIADAGMNGDWGVGIGRVILARGPEDDFIRARAYAAAASEARMAGCPLTVVTNSGSGNQGITCSVPLIVLAEAWGKSEEDLMRALVFSNLLTIHQKTGIGRLSAFCGAVSAACAAGAGMTYLRGGSLMQIEWTIANTLANVPGIICDGAKPSCAAKIAASLEAAILGHQLAMESRKFNHNSGILQPDVEVLIQNVGRIAKLGMAKTDQVIMDLMIE